MHLYMSMKFLKQSASYFWIKTCVTTEAKILTRITLSDQWSHTVQQFTSASANSRILPRRRVLKYSHFMLTY